RPMSGTSISLCRSSRTAEPHPGRLLVGRPFWVPPTMNRQSLEWVDRFRRYLATERQVSPHTTAAYCLELAALVEFCDREKLEHWSAIEVKHVRAFAARSHRRGLSPGSVQRRLSAVRTFMKFLISEGVIGANVAELVQAPKAVRK